MAFKIKTIENDEQFLRQKSKTVLKDDKELSKDLKKLSSYCKTIDIFALASIQLGIPKKIIYIKNTDLSMNYETDEQLVMINPEIIDEKGETYYWELCMSCPNLIGKVKRPYSITVKYLDKNFNEKQEIFEGEKATVISHEYDHLFGIIHTDIAEEVFPIKFEDRKEFRKQDGHGYTIISKTGKYKHPLR